MKLKTKLSKFLIGTVFLIAICISSIQVAFAEQDISTLISQWFDQQKTSAVASMESSIESEKEQQVIRLKAHLQSEMERAQGELSAFEQQQIDETVEALRQHTSQLMASVSYSNEAEKQAIINELNFIFNSAILAMGSVNLVEIPPVETEPPGPPGGNNGNPGNSGNGQGAGNDGNNNGNGPGGNNGNGPGENNGSGKGNDKPGNGKGNGKNKGVEDTESVEQPVTESTVTPVVQEEDDSSTKETSGGQ
ncbi:hypothetical protein ACFO0S_09305 [Chryseomicrobium palamuruense]|uniref:Uncharacterized protein n=1 Tax=Chryseomicrobium palamuruense TaxID=682973 RepID=A0ABV8UWZ4_9BACL